MDGKRVALSDWGAEDAPNGGSTCHEGVRMPVGDRMI